MIERRACRNAENEKKVLKAVAVAQAETGAPVIIHPGRHPTAPAEALNVLQEAGGDARRTVMSHLDRTFVDRFILLVCIVIGNVTKLDDASKLLLCRVRGLNAAS